MAKATLEMGKTELNHTLIEAFRNLTGISPAGVRPVDKIGQFHNGDLYESPAGLEAISQQLYIFYQHVDDIATFVELEEYRTKVEVVVHRPGALDRSREYCRTHPNAMSRDIHKALRLEPNRATVAAGETVKLADSGSPKRDSPRWAPG